MSAGSLTQGHPTAVSPAADPAPGRPPVPHPAAGRPEHYVLRILDALRSDPERAVVHWREAALTAGALHASVVQATQALRRAGVDAVSTVALLTDPNHPVMLNARYAAHLLGAAVVHVRSMNPRSDADSFPLETQAEILHTTGVRVLVVDDAHTGRGRELAERVPGLTVLDGRELPGPAACPSRPPLSGPPEPAPFVPGDLAVIDFTSGSTDKPKMVRQSFGTRETLIELLSGGQADTGPATLLSVTPISHTTAPMADSVLAGGGALVLHEGFDADAVLRDVAGVRVTDAYLAVPHLYRLLDHPGIGDADLSSLRRVIYSGTPASPARVTDAVEVFGDVLIQVYGTTEAGGITSLTQEDHREPELLGSVGRPFPWVRLEIRDPDSPTALERGQVGEVCVHSPTLMDGYLGERPGTGRTLRDGWLRTGDLGRWDRYGYLRLVGRVGRVIKSGGLKLDPAVIEGALLAHPQVKNATVYGVRDPDYVEHVHAAVELRDGDCTSGDLRAHVADALSAAHVPAEISLWDELPLNGSGKPDLAFLRTRKGAP